MSVRNILCRRKALQMPPGHKKTEDMVSGRILQKMSFLIRTVTVGSGIPVIKDTSPDQPPKRVMDYTIGRDFHPATKTFGIQL